MFEKEAEIKLSEEEYKLAEEVIYPLFHKVRQNGDSLAKYGVECYLAGLNKANEWHFTNRNEERLVIDCPKGKENKLYLLLLNSRDSKEYEFGRIVPVVCYWNEEWYRFERLEHTIGERNINPNDINAWKEIVLPELPKESK